MKIKNIFLNTTKVLVFSGLLISGACSSLIDVQPRQSIDSSTALTSPEAIRSGLAASYARLRNLRIYGRDLIALPEALSDNGTATNKSGRLLAENLNNPYAHFANWQVAYISINQINLLIEATEKLNADAAFKKQINGEAKFLRALFYFDLMRAFAYDPNAIVAASNKGGVPLILKGSLDVGDVTLPARASIDEVYAQIIKDLEAAIADLPARASSPHNATGGAAMALLSRVHLYKGDWANAAKFATDALASRQGTFATSANYVASWRTPINPESMFEVLFFNVSESPGVNESLQSTYTTMVALGNRTTTGGFGDLVPTDGLLAELNSEAGDLRRSFYELGTAGRGTARIECTKFLGKNGVLNLDNVPLIRVSEMYLNRAEALAMSGNDAGALADLNAIRTRAGLPARTGLAGTALMTEILRQRRLELAFEGHRWFDLKRRGLDVVKSPSTIAFSDFRILANLPIREIQANTNLVQNPGY